MKNAKTISLLLGSVLLLASSALAQTTSATPTNNAAEPDPVAAARSPYIQAEGGTAVAGKSSAEDQSPNEPETLAQFSPRRAGPHYRPPTRPPMGRYPGPRSAPAPNPHVVLGAIVGFGAAAGVTAGAGKSSGEAVGAGIFGAIFGGVIGAVVSWGHPYHRYRPWEDEGYDELDSHAQPHSTDQKASSVAERTPASKNPTAAATESNP